MDAIKRAHDGPIAPSVLEQRLIDYFSAKGSMVLTNVPGPQHTLSVAGTPLGGVLVWAPCSVASG
jgi:diacylglycerol O-acyltransferase